MIRLKAKQDRIPMYEVSERRKYQRVEKPIIIRFRSWTLETQEEDNGEEIKVNEEAVERQKLADTLLNEILGDSQEREKKAGHWRIHELLTWLHDFHRRCD